MSDVNAFVDGIGRDVNSVVAPKVESLAHAIGAKATADYVPQITGFIGTLLKQVIADQSTTVRDFSTALIQDLFQRYRPEIAGELHARIVNGGLEVNGQGVRLDVTRRDNGAVVSSLDIPVSVRINVADLGVTLQNTTLRLDVVR